MNSLLLRSILFKTNLRSNLLLISETNRRHYVVGMDNQQSRHSPAEPSYLLGLNLSHAFSTNQANGDRTPPDLLQKYTEFDKIKKLSPYSYFMKINYKELKSEQPDSEKTVLFSKLNQKWKSLGEEEKLQYFKMADENRVKAEESIAILQSKLSEKESQKLLEDAKNKRALRRKFLKQFRAKKKQKLLGKPIKPATSFLRWLMTLDRGNASLLEFTKAAGIKWKSLPEQEKKKYEVEYQQDMKEYKEKLKLWEGKMIINGNMSLVRKMTRIRLIPDVKSKKMKKAKLDLIKKKRQILLMKKTTEKKLKELKSLKSKLHSISVRKSKQLYKRKRIVRKLINKIDGKSAKKSSESQEIKE